MVINIVHIYAVIIVIMDVKGVKDAVQVVTIIVQDIVYLHRVKIIVKDVKVIVELIVKFGVIPDVQVNAMRNVVMVAKMTVQTIVEKLTTVKMHVKLNVPIFVGINVKLIRV